MNKPSIDTTDIGQTMLRQLLATLRRERRRRTTFRIAFSACALLLVALTAMELRTAPTASPHVTHHTATNTAHDEQTFSTLESMGPQHKGDASNPGTSALVPVRRIDDDALAALLKDKLPCVGVVRVAGTHRLIDVCR
jgi:hypothetical protein